MNDKKKAIVLVVLTVAIAALAISLFIPVAFEPFGGSPCNRPSNCDAGATVRIVANPGANETTFNVSEEMVQAHPVLGNILDSVRNTSAFPTAQVVGPGEIVFGLRTEEAQEIARVLGHPYSLVRFRGETYWVSVAFY